MDVEIKVTQTAQQIFNEATESYIRVGANPGGCSGWKYELASTNDKLANKIALESSFSIGRFFPFKDIS